MVQSVSRTYGKFMRAPLGEARASVTNWALHAVFLSSDHARFVSQAVPPIAWHDDILRMSCPQSVHCENRLCETRQLVCLRWGHFRLHRAKSQRNHHGFRFVHHTGDGRVLRCCDRRFRPVLDGYIYIPIFDFL